MRYEYLLFNIIVVAGPITLSFDRNTKFIRKWLPALTASIFVGIPFIIWDIAVTHSHWRFNPDYISGYSLIGLPLEEWLFFITVPFACLFLWEVFLKRSSRVSHRDLFLKRIGVSLIALFVSLGATLLFFGKLYSGVVFLVSGLVLIADMVLQTRVFMRQTSLRFAGLLLLLITLFNGYLTARPVVIYDPEFITNIRIGSIPVEDYFYGFALVLGAVVIYEKLKEVYHV